MLLVYIRIVVGLPYEMVASDPGAHSRYAFGIAQRSSLEDLPNHPFAHRFSVSLPTALFYRLFAVSAITGNLWSLCAAPLIMVAVYLALPTPRSKAIGVALCASSVTLFIQSQSLRPISYVLRLWLYPRFSSHIALDIPHTHEQTALISYRPLRLLTDLPCSA